MGGPRLRAWARRLQLGGDWADDAVARPSRRVELAGLALLVLAAVALWAAARTYPHFDTQAHLVWGRDLLHGEAPGYQDQAAPTPHPLQLGAAAILSLLLGDSADQGLVLVTLLCWAAMLFGVYRLGAIAISPPVGALAVVFVATSATVLTYTTRAYVDVPFLALVVWAAVVAAGQPQRRVLIMSLLALAGLLRPEAWLLSALYFAWVAYTTRSVRMLLPLAAIGASAPVIWAAIDLAVTGDALFSLHKTQSGAAALGRTRGLDNVPGSVAGFLGDILRKPVAALGAIGIVAGVWLLGARRLAVPLALLVFGIVAFAGIGIAELSILPRYVLVPALALALFAAFPLMGWSALRRDRPLVRPWRLGSFAALALGAAGIVVAGPNTAQFSDHFRHERALQRDLEAVLEDPAVRRCAGPRTFPGPHLLPDAEWILGADAEGVRSRTFGPPRAGVQVVLRDPRAVPRIVFAPAERILYVPKPEPGFEPLAAHGMFAAYGKCR